MLNKPKVLLGTTISSYKDYILPLWLTWIKGLIYSNINILLVDNSPDKKYHKQFLQYGFEIIHTPINNRPIREVMAKGDEIIRERVLSGKYDYYFSLECDNFCPLNTIEYLISKNQQVISLPYFASFADETYILIQDNQMIKTATHTFTNKIVNNLNYYSFIKYFDGDIHQIYGSGKGCMLIKKEVLEKIKFRVDDTTEGYPDSFLYFDLFMNKIPNMIDTSTICKHMNADWSVVKEDT